MTPAASAPAIELKSELTDLQAKITAAKTKLAQDETALAELIDERARMAESVASGRMKPEAVGECARKLEIAESTVEGQRSILKRLNNRFAEVYPQIQRIEADEQHAARVAEFEELKRKGAAVATRINAALEQLLAVDFPAFDAIRDSLSKQYADLGGYVAQTAMIRAIKKENDELTVERKLRSAGWARRYDLQLDLRNLHPPKR